jgi:hypothetical protein
MSFLYTNKIIQRLHNAFIGNEFEASFLYAQGDKERLILQRRLFLGLLLSVLVFVSLSCLPVMPLIIFIASLLPFFLTYYLRIIVLKDRLKKHSIALERALPLLKLEIKFLLKIADNEYDIQKIFVQSLQYISPAENGSQFYALVKMMILGMPVEKILSEFESPSRKLNGFIRGCSDVKALPFLGDDLETFSKYKVFLKTLESRMVILVAEAIFLPILASLIFAFQNVDVGVHVVFIAVHIVILKYLARFLLNEEFSMLYFVGLFPDQSKRMLDDFVSFLILLGENLKYHSPEKALALSFARMSRGLRHLLGINHLENAWATNFHETMEGLSTAAGSSVISLIFNLINRFKDYASVDLARFIVDIAVELKRQKEIEEEKINTIHAERFKVRILVVCLTLILSILSVLFPLLARGTRGSVIDAFSSLSGGGTLPASIFVMINLFYNYTSCFYLLKITGIQSAHRYTIIVSFLFVVIYIFGFSFFNKLM